MAEGDERADLDRPRRVTDRDAWEDALEHARFDLDPLEHIVEEPRQRHLAGSRGRDGCWLEVLDEDVPSVDSQIVEVPRLIEGLPHVRLSSTNGLRRNVELLT